MANARLDLKAKGPQLAHRSAAALVAQKLKSDGGKVARGEGAWRLAGQSNKESANKVDLALEFYGRPEGGLEYVNRGMREGGELPRVQLSVPELRRTWPFQSGDPVKVVTALQSWKQDRVFLTAAGLKLAPFKELARRLPTESRQDLLKRLPVSEKTEFLQQNVTGASALAVFPGEAPDYSAKAVPPNGAGTGVVAATMLQTEHINNLANALAQLGPGVDLKPEFFATIDAHDLGQLVTLLGKVGASSDLVAKLREGQRARSGFELK